MAAPSGALRADLGAHVPAAWPLSARYNGSVDSSEEWELNVASRLASRVPRPRSRRRRRGICNGCNEISWTGDSPAYHLRKLVCYLGNGTRYHNIYFYAYYTLLRAGAREAL